MKNFEQNLPYPFLAVLVLAVFYGIYFAKMFAQKRRGIKTHQIGMRKEKTLHRVETLMSAATLGIVLAQLLSVAANWSFLTYGARFMGFVTGLSGDAVFLSAVLCMKDSWRAGIPGKDKTKIVTEGVYKFSRNPAFLGFDLMYIGVFLMYANVLTGFFTVFAVLMLHLQILQEEKYMLSEFGEEYADYKKHVCRYLGRRIK